MHRGGFAAVDPVGGPVPGVRLRLPAGREQRWDRGCRGGGGGGVGKTPPRGPRSPVATKAGGLLEAAGQAGAGAVEVTGAGTGAARRRRAGHGERDGAARCPAT